MQSTRKTLGFVGADRTSNQTLEILEAGDPVPWPRVGFVVVSVFTSVAKDAAPEDIVDSYNDWQQWALEVQQVSPALVLPASWTITVHLLAVSSNVWRSLLSFTCVHDCSSRSSYVLPCLSSCVESLIV